MPLKIMTPELRRKQASRVLVFGAPNTWKTTSVIKTAIYPLSIVSVPGETGWATIPYGVPGLTSFVWEEPAGDPVTSDSMRKEVEDATYQIVAGKHGPVNTLCLDGLHKIFPMYLNIVTGGAYSRGEEFEPRLYARAYEMFDRYLDKVLSSPVPYIIATTWNAREPDKEGSKDGQSAQKSMHEWPDLPGKMAKRIVGRFSVVVYAKVDPPVIPGQPYKGMWLLRPTAEVWGASVKMDPRMVEKLPVSIPQNFKQLYQVVGAAQAEIAEVKNDSEPVVPVA